LEADFPSEVEQARVLIRSDVPDVHCGLVDGDLLNAVLVEAWDGGEASGAVARLSHGAVT